MKKIITISITLVLLLLTACSSHEVEIYNRLGQDASDFYDIQDKDVAIGLLAEDLEQQLEERETAVNEATAEPTATPTETPTPEPTPAAVPVVEQTPVQSTYILNTNTKKFHKPNCSSVSDMKESNKQEFTGNRDEVIGMGYVPCKRCNP